MINSLYLDTDIRAWTGEPVKLRFGLMYTISNIRSGAISYVIRCQPMCCTVTKRVSMYYMQDV